MYKDIINQRRGDFNAAFEHTRTEISSIRTGRASSSLVEDIVVDYMGSKLKVKELATITIPEPRVVFVQPWDKGAIPLIEKAISSSPMGLNPASDSSGVRITLPPLVEEKRKELIKLLGHKIEEGKIKTRQIREDVLKRVQAEVREKKAREDDMHKTKDELQKIMDDINKKFEELAQKKEAELMA